jgi:glutathione peroxidase
MPKNIYSYEFKDIQGKPVKMSQFKGQVLLVVNTASKCGFTPQYKGLEELYQKHKDSGLQVLGFPCNQFGSQEPGDEQEINQFCELNYGVSFPLFSKINVNGDSAHPLFEELKNQAPGLLGTKKIKWNFTKFLIDTKGHVTKRYAPQDKPEMIERDILKLL